MNRFVVVFLFSKEVARVFGRNSQAPLSSAAAARLAYVCLTRLTNGPAQKQVKSGKLGNLQVQKQCAKKKINFQ